MNKLSKKHAETRRINELLRHLERDEGYFSVICEALEIDHSSKLTEILVAIDELKSNQAGQVI